MLAKQTTEDACLPAGVSVVIPSYRSEKTLPALVARLAAVLARCTEHFEIVLVNDGSPDGTWDVIGQLAQQHPYVRGINLLRNYGQHNALLCGIRAARYDTTVTMDDDLQHPPEEIPKLLEKLSDRASLVYGAEGNQGAFHFSRFLSSWTVFIALAFTTRQPKVLRVSSFRAFRTYLRGAFAEFRSPEVIIDALLGWSTTKIESVPVNYAPRPVGKSNYSFWRLLSFAIVLWTSFTTVPLRLASLLGLGFVFFGAGLLVYVLAHLFIKGSAPGFTFLASTVVLFGGTQLIVLGIIGEYLAKVFERSMDRPSYIVWQQIESRNASRIVGA